VGALGDEKYHQQKDGSPKQPSVQLEPAAQPRILSCKPFAAVLLICRFSVNFLLHGDLH